MMSESGTTVAATAAISTKSTDNLPTADDGEVQENGTNSVQPSWVKFGNDEANEEVATIQPSSTEQFGNVDSKRDDRRSKQSATRETTLNAKNNSMLPTTKQTEISIEEQSNAIPLSPPRSPNAPPMGSINMSQVIRPNNREPDEKFANGDVICTVLPTNKSCAWVTRAKFHPNYVPEEIMDTSLSITVEDYVMALQILTNDFRFTVYNVLYKRVLLLWMTLGFVILLSLLFSGSRGLALFGGGVFWLLVNASGIFVCLWLKFKLYHMLERCVAHVNNVLVKHNILMGLDDRGKLSCHKVHLIFTYFETEPCIRYICQMLEDQEKADAHNQIIAHPVNRNRMDLAEEDDSIVITRGSVTERISQREKTAEKLLLRYSQRWVKGFIRKRLDLSAPIHPDGFSEPEPPAPPRHCSMAKCPCQFIEEHLRYKPLTQCSWTELCC